MLPALLLALFAARPATAQTPLTTPADAPVGVTAGDAASTSESPSSAAASANRAAPAPLNTIAVGHRELPSIPPTRQARRQIAERSEEHTSELQSLMRISYAVFCLKKKTRNSNDVTATTKTHRPSSHTPNSASTRSHTHTHT